MDASVGATPCGRPLRINIDIYLKRATTGGRPYRKIDIYFTKQPKKDF